MGKALGIGKRLELLDLLARSERMVEEYAAGHIPGALSIPLDELPHQLADLPDDQEIVAYCRGAYCVLAHDAVRLLTAQGQAAVDKNLNARLLRRRPPHHPTHLDEVVSLVAEVADPPAN